MKDASLVEISSTQFGKEEWALTFFFMLRGPRIVSAEAMTKWQTVNFLPANSISCEKWTVAKGLELLAACCDGICRQGPEF
jgi:hypothetical protein